MIDPALRLLGGDLLPHRPSSTSTPSNNLHEEMPALTPGDEQQEEEPSRGVLSDKRNFAAMGGEEEGDGPAKKKRKSGRPVNNPETRTRPPSSIHGQLPNTYAGRKGTVWGKFYSLFLRFLAY
jgi:hypothetical protein